METKTGVKIFFIILVLLWIIFALPPLYSSGGESIGGDLAILVLGIITPIGLTVALTISIINDIKHNNEKAKEKTKKEEHAERQISLTRNILNIVAKSSKPLSVYDFMMQIQETEDNIESELEHFVEKGLAEKIANEKGLTLYKFLFASSDIEQNDEKNN